MQVIPTSCLREQHRNDTVLRTVDEFCLPRKKAISTKPHIIKLCKPSQTSVEAVSDIYRIFRMLKALCLKYLVTVPLHPQILKNFYTTTLTTATVVHFPVKNTVLMYASDSNFLPPGTA